MSLWAHLEFPDLVRHSSSGSGDQSLDSVHASTEIIIHTNGLRQAGTFLGYPNTEIMTLQKGTFSLLKRSGTPDFHGWCGRRRTLIQGWISSKAAGVAQDPLEKTQQSCLLMGEGGKSCLQQDVPFCRGRWWQLGWGKEKKMQDSTLCGKRSLPCLPQPACPWSHQTGHCSSQPTLQEGLTAHSPLPLGNLHPSTSGLAPGMKKQQLFPWRGGQRKQKEVGKVMAASTSSSWASSGATWVGCYPVQLSYYLYRASVPPDLNGFFVSLILCSSVFLSL